MENEKIVDTVEALTYSQEQVDKIFAAAALAANNQRIPLAKMAVAETGMGIVEDKVIKNHYAAEYIYNKYKNMQTVGVIEEDTAFGIKKIAEPIGVVASLKRIRHSASKRSPNPSASWRRSSRRPTRPRLLSSKRLSA